MLQPLLVALSALFYCFAQLISGMSWLVVPAVIVWIAFCSFCFEKKRIPFLYIVLWNAAVVVFHFRWLYWMLAIHFITQLEAFMITGVIVAVAILTTSVSMIITGWVFVRLSRKTPFLKALLAATFGCLGGWWLIEYCAFWWISPEAGCLYPYLCPWVILADTRWFLWIIALFGSWVGYQRQCADVEYEIRFISPIDRRRWDVRHNFDPEEGCRQVEKIYHRLVTENKGTSDQVFYVGGESLIPFDPLHVPLIAQAMRYAGPGAHCFIGCKEQDGGHAVGWFHDGRLQQTAYKTIFMPGVESLPCGGFGRSWFLKKFFKDYKPFPLVKREGGQLFKVGDGLIVRPFICSDFFISDMLVQVALGARSLDEEWWVFCNDSWFPPFFTELMMRSVRLKSAFYHQKVVYVGHAKSLRITPFSGTF